VGIEPATAAIDVSASATVGAEYNSNAFELSEAEAPPVESGGNAHRSDVSRRLSVNFGVGLIGSTDGPIRVQLDANLIDAGFDRFDTISRRDHDVGVTLEWKPIQQPFDVSLKASHSRTPIQLADVVGEQATQQTALRTQGTLGLRPTPRWQVGLTPAWSEVRTPLPDAQDFKFRETSGSVSLGFLGAGRLVPGVAVTESQGRNSGIDNATRYRQRSVQATFNYAATAASTFALSLGHTRRTTRFREPSEDPADLGNEDSDSAFTGALTFHRQLSVKTGLNISAYRYFQQYDAGVNTTLGTGIGTGVTWAATAKVSATLDAGLNWATIDDVQVGDTFVQRKDLTRSYSLGVSYTLMRRVSLRSYIARSVRTSDVSSAQFNNTLAGLELTATIF
jgi:hypothetical protein